MSDPLIAAIVTLVLLFIVREAITVALVWLGIIIGTIVAAASKKSEAGAIVIGVGVLLAVVWQITAIIWIIADVVNILQLL